MTNLYALLVGIDTYHAQKLPGPEMPQRLHGCGNDIIDVRDYLETRMDSTVAVNILELVDGQATRAGVIDGFRTHLGKAHAGDSALFWFCGHGSYAPVPAELSHLEPSGTLQTILCADSRYGDVPDLLDKELSILISAVAQKGVRVTAVLDCCHAASGTRDLERLRQAPALTAPPTVDSLLPELRQRERIEALFSGPGRPADHVALAACREFEGTSERMYGGRFHGVFTHALLAALEPSRPISYRQLIAAARLAVENAVSGQVPQLYPVDGVLADRQFLTGTAMPAHATLTMRRVRGRWEIDAGACHGLTPSDEGVAKVGIHGSKPIQEAVVTQVLPDRSVVSPIGPEPNPDNPHPVVITDVAMPTAIVVMNTAPPYHDDTAAAVAQAIGTALPGDPPRPSPHLRLVTDTETADTADTAEASQAKLWIATPRPGLIRVHGGDFVPLCHDIASDDMTVSDVVACDGDAVRAAARRAVTTLEHIARWRQVKALKNPLSGLARQVGIDVVEAGPDERRVDMARTPLRTGPDGAIQLRYRQTADGWKPPRVFVRLHNTSDRRLFFVLLNLTDRYSMHSSLFPGAFVGPRSIAVAAAGGAIAFTLPASQAATPGARCHDWLTLLVAEDEFASAPLQLPPLGEPEAPRTRGPGALASVINRLGTRALYRQSDPAESSALDWLTMTVAVTTTVPVDAGPAGVPAATAPYA